MPSAYLPKRCCGPVRWVKPGVLELSLERVYRRDEVNDDITGFTASFAGRGKWKVLKKKR